MSTLYTPENVYKLTEYILSYFALSAYVLASTETIIIAIASIPLIIQRVLQTLAEYGIIKPPEKK